jgi:hypothetical protein
MSPCLASRKGTARCFRRGGMSILSIDMAKDEGTFTEPNIWIRHL